MGPGHILALILAALISLLFSVIGLLFRKKDIFSMLNDPCVGKYPKLSKTFGTVLILFSVIWFLCVAWSLCA